MDIKEIRNPKFLKDLSYSELQELAVSIRHFLIESISQTGGHLSSNLGIVELTIALHTVFDSPVDKIFFDVGHQSYVHKILTGRANQFPTLRQYHGLSGFQKIDESIHDVWEAGHASTSLSAAAAMAVTRDLNHDNYHIVPVIGDGSLGGGMALEALNHIASMNKRVIIILNDNNMSISATSGPISKMIGSIRVNHSYVAAKNDVKDSLSQNQVGEKVLKGLTGIKSALKKTVIHQPLFTGMGFDYFGPIDGHDIKALIHTLNAAKRKNGPVLIHVYTKKGKGYKPCENDITGQWHGVGRFDIENGLNQTAATTNYIAWSKAVADTIYDLATVNKDIVTITPAMTMGSSLEKIKNRFPSRFYDCGIAEEHATTFAAALALNGKRPFLSIYSTFLQRAYDQINHDICRLNVPVFIGIDRSGIVGEDGDTHQGVFDIGILRPLPNIIISQGKDYQETRDLIYTAFQQNQPFALRYPKGDVLVENKNIPYQTLPIGRWSILVNQVVPQAIVIGYGPQIDKIANKVSINNLPYLVINARFIKPLDDNMLIKLAALNCPIFTYEEEMLTGGLSSAISEFFIDQKLSVTMYRIGIDDQYVEHGSILEVKKALKIDINSFFEFIQQHLK